MGRPLEDVSEQALLERDINATIKLLLSEIEMAARMLPVDACHPYEAERRRKVVIRAVWNIGRRATAQE